MKENDGIICKLSRIMRICTTSSSANYEIEDATVFKQINEGSEPFLLWITGEAYNEN